MPAGKEKNGRETLAIASVNRSSRELFYKGKEKSGVEGRGEHEENNFKMKE